MMLGEIRFNIAEFILVKLKVSLFFLLSQALTHLFYLSNKIFRNQENMMTANCLISIIRAINP